MAAANESPRVSVEKRGFVIVHDTMHESIILRSATSHVFLLYRRQNDDRAHPTLVVRSAARYFVFDLEKTTRVSSALKTNSTSRAVPIAYRSTTEPPVGERFRIPTFVRRPQRIPAYHANLRDCAPSNKCGALSLLSRWWRLRAWFSSLPPFAAAQGSVKNVSGGFLMFSCLRNSRI